jgi:hypothetical protein
VSLLNPLSLLLRSPLMFLSSPLRASCPSRFVSLALQTAFVTTLLALTACGGSYDTHKVKNYRLSLVAGDADLKDEFRKLIADYNDFAGMEALTWVDDADDANSAIVVTKGLKLQDGHHIGWGQWMSDAESENPLATPGRRPKREVVYSMRVEFDEDWIRARMGHDDPKKTYDNQKLFFHEVGHGLELSHAANPNDVMYEEVSGNKDFVAYFDYVRDYLSDL